MVQTRSRRGPSPEEAEALAVAAFSFLASDAERLGVFLAETGLEPDTVRGAASDPGFLAGVLDHLLSREDLLLDFAAERDVDPATVAASRRLLPGAPVEF